jgi:DNA polymerase I-like protein with 3'-5' exonuclease and polymerase domains
LLLQVHDSLVFECAPDVVDDLVTTVKLVMEQPWKELGGYSIPISVKVGDSWGD